MRSPKHGIHARVVLAGLFLAGPIGVHAEEAKPPVAPTEDPNQKLYESLMAKGLSKLDAKDWSGAENAYDLALRLKPNDAAARGGLMLAQSKLKELQPAKPVTPPKPPSEVGEVAADKPPEPNPEPEKKPEHPLPPLPGVERKPEAAQPKVADTKPVVAVAAAPEVLDFNEPVKMSVDEWDKGAGSSCYWAGTRLHLAEGDEMYRLPIRGNFAAQFQIEAEMQQDSMIFIELRPDGKKGNTVRGYGAKEGSPPFLMSGKQTVAKAKKQPGLEQITLGFRRTGKQIEFFFNGDKVGETWDIPEGTVLWLWVGGKGIVDKFSINKR